MALTLQPKLAPAAGDEATAYDAALALTEGDVAAYWRPAKDSFLSRINRDQLLAIARDMLGEAWAQSRCQRQEGVAGRSARPGLLRSGQAGRTAEQVEKLKSWLPAGMAFGIAATAKPAKAKKARKAA